MKVFSQRTHIFIFIAVCFFITTAQTLWNTIHGDGAVYAWLIKGVVENTSDLLSRPLSWTQTSYFCDHPYLFFYLSAPIVKIFGISDIGVKIPNYIFGFLTLMLVYKIVSLRSASFAASVLACYVLITNPLYELMLRQPTLDPLAQLLSLFSIFILLYGKWAWTRSWSLKFFFAGLFMGLAFLTKGLELLPNLAALFIVACLLIYKNRLNPIKLLSFGILGTMVPLAAWVWYDHTFWNQQWTNHYFQHQIKNRFFGPSNTQEIFSLAYLKNLISKYFIQLALVGWGTYQTLKRKKSLDLFWWYAAVYTLFNIMAFSIIKKDSSQHLTGVFVFTSILIGPYLYEMYLTLKSEKIKNKFQKFMSGFHLFLLVGSFSMWSYFVTQKNTKDDLWNFIKNQKSFFAQPENKLPIVVDPSVTDLSAIYFTGQWYWTTNKIYFTYEAQNLLKGQSAFLLTGKDDKSFNIQKAIY